MRRAALAAAIPPVGTSGRDEIEASTGLPLFTCKFVCENGEECGKQFSSYKSLRIHQLATRFDGQHGYISFVQRANTVNWCLACGRVYVDRAQALLHLRKSLESGVCSGSGGLFGAPPQFIDAVECPVCYLDMSDFTQNGRRGHLLLHFPQPLVALGSFAEEELSDLEELPPSVLGSIYDGGPCTDGPGLAFVGFSGDYCERNARCEAEKGSGSGELPVGIIVID